MKGGRCGFIQLLTPTCNRICAFWAVHCSIFCSEPELYRMHVTVPSCHVTNHISAVSADPHEECAADAHLPLHQLAAPWQPLQTLLWAWSEWLELSLPLPLPLPPPLPDNCKWLEVSLKETRERLGRPCWLPRAFLKPVSPVQSICSMSETP